MGRGHAAEPRRDFQAEPAAGPVAGAPVTGFTSPARSPLIGGLNTGSRGLANFLAPALAAIAVLVTYGVIACTADSELGSRTPAEDYYNRLVAGFTKGQLALDLAPPAALARLADPYDPRANAPFQGEA